MSCSERYVEGMYGKLIEEDKKKRRELYEHFIKEKEIDNTENKINIVKKISSVVVVKKVEMTPCERFERDMEYNNEMNELWENTFQGIENIANDAASEAVGIQSSLIYGTTYLILTPFAAMGICAIGVGKYIFK